ncbi:AAA family ATPase [Streptomyces dioscori]|uniref:AAA family ATPase n=1 Tax=Streptomyces dioscori TaxID=2109333 RepID=A0A2P8PXM8_9ACTN|nr:ATP-binding protein [Streptomyces dioscori]PSM38744.1 AAA family ATPase [Streptomyces dioscori]
MYLSRISVWNVKSFHGPREVVLDLARPDGSYAGWTVLAGRNGSGKTTLLRAVALAVIGPDNARRIMPSFEAWASEGAEVAEASVKIVPGYEVDHRGIDGTLFADVQPPDTFMSELRWQRRGAPAKGPYGGSQTEPSLSAGHSLNVEGGDLFAPGGLWDSKPVGWLLAGYGSFRRLSGGDDRPRKRVGVFSRVGTLFDEDLSLAEGVGWLVGQHLRALEGDEAAAELKATALAVLGDGLLPDGCRVVDVDSEGLWVDWEGRRFPLREMSDGLRTITALVVDLLRQVYESYAVAREVGLALTEQRHGRIVVSVPGVVLIDEVDAHLHVSWQRRIGPWLTAHFPGIQFIVTTHSPYICQSADPGGLVRLPGPGEQAGPHVVDEDLYERVVYGSGDDAALSELFGLDSPYSEKAEALRAELVALEGAVLRGTADAVALARYTRIKQLLTSSPSARLDEMSAGLARLADEEPRAAGDGELGE